MYDTENYLKSKGKHGSKVVNIEGRLRKEKKYAFHGHVVEGQHAQPDDEVAAS